MQPAGPRRRPAGAPAGKPAAAVAPGDAAQAIQRIHDLEAIDAAEMWIRYLGPASDPAKVRAGTADTLYAAIFDSENEAKSCNGTFGRTSSSMSSSA
jgi:hypothetical protein